MAYVNNETQELQNNDISEKELSEKENADHLRDENYRVWKEIYQKVYNEQLKYGE